VAQPPIDAYIPTKVYNEESVVEIKDLECLIKDVEVSDAILVYQLLQKNNVEVPDSVKQSLLELICFYNHEDSLSEDLIEERWFRQGTRGRDRQRKTWKDNELAEQIFAEMKEKTPAAYSAIIRGMCKYFQVEKAWALYDESVSKSIGMDVDTYNLLLSVASFLKEKSDMKWELIQEIFTAMKNQKLKPNLGTLNSTLHTISTIGNYRQSRDFALKVLAEFKGLGIEPSLGSWYYILIIFCKERGPVSHVLVDIMNQLDGKEFQIQDIKDTFFFVTAMDICRNHLHDKELAKRVDNLLHLGENYNLIGDSYKESIYYRHYFSLLCNTEPLEKFMKTYELLVPNVYIPEPSVMEDILRAIEANVAIEYIPKIWSDIIIFDHISRENLITGILRIMIQNPTEQETLKEHFGKVAWDIWAKIEEQNEMRSQQLQWSGKLLGDILILLCRVGDFEKADIVFQKLDKDQHKVLGEPSIDSVKAFVELCALNKTPSKAVNCLQYCVDMGFPEAREIGRLISMKFTLDERLMTKLTSLVGNFADEK
jgi:pentatricopeptide repeat domain-containing protein 3